jgi:hypothetical protein
MARMAMASLGLRLEVSRLGKGMTFQIRPETYADAEAKI